MRWGNFKQISPEKGLWLQWPEVFTTTEEKLTIQELWKVSGRHCYQNPHVQMLAKWPQSDKRNLGGRELLGLRPTQHCMVLLLLHVIIAPGFPLGLCRASSPRHWTGCRTGPRKPRSSWCSCATWSSRSRYGQHLRQSKPWGIRCSVPWGSLSVSFLLFLCVVRKFLFIFFCSVSSNTYKCTCRPTWNIPLLEAVMFANKPETTWFSKWFLSSARRS